MAAVRSKQAHVVWTAGPGRRQAFVTYSGRLFRMVYDSHAKVLAIAFADKAEPVSAKKVRLQCSDIVLIASADPANSADMQKFLKSSFSTFRDIGVL